MRKNEVFYMAVICLTYLLNKCFFTKVINNIFVDGYLNDLLCGMLFANIIVVVCRFWIRIEMSNVYVIFLVLIAGFFWEYVTPLYRDISVSDSFDIACYYLGGVIYTKLRGFL